jgi:hypothetical protein
LLNKNSALSHRRKLEVTSEAKEKIKTSEEHNSSLSLVAESRILQEKSVELEDTIWNIILKTKKN